MSRLVKCPYCEKQVRKDESHPHGKRYYHVDCFNEWQKQSQHRKELIEYICNLYGIEIPSGMMLKQIKDYAEEYKYKYKGMELALRYFHETLENPVKEGTGIGIIPFVYEDAKRHYMTKMNVEESLKQVDQLSKSKSIIVESPKNTYSKKMTEIDISAL